MKLSKDEELKHKNDFDIAEHKQIKKQLQVKDFAIQSSISSIAFADMKGKITYVNDALIKLLGYSGEDEVLGRHISEFAVSKEQIKDILSTLYSGEGYVGEGYALKKDGTTFIAQLSANLVTASDKKPICMMASFIDISAHRKAEKEAQKSNIQFHSLFDNMLEGYAYCKVLFKNSRPIDFTYLEVNKKFEDLTGLKNVIDKKVSEVIPGILDSNQELIETYGRVAITEIPEKIETYLPDIDMWFSVAVYCPQKEYFIAVFNVITERKAAEEKLKNTQLLLKASIESPKNMVIFAIDKDYNYLFFNHVYKDAIARLYGKEVKIGMNSLDCITLKADRANAKTGYDRALNGEFNSAIQEYGEKERNFYETFYNPIFNENNKIIGVAVFSRDIAERISAEKALKESEQKYRQLFNNMTLGFGLHEMIYDKKGNAADYRFLDINPAFEKLTGLKASAILGKTVKKVLPDTEQYWLENYSKVFQNNRQVIFENYSKNLKKWYDVRAFKAGENRFAALFSDITEQKQSILRLQNILNDTTKAFSSIIEVKDPYTSGHQERVAKLSVAIAEELKLDEKIISAIKTAALLHDLGKIAIPSSILSKPSKLTNLEFGIIKEHPQIGYEVLKDVDYDYPIAKIVLQHHERNNGSGYPEGIKDKDIMLEAKIIAIADTVEAMSSHRPYRPAIGISEALKEIDNNKGLLYDAGAVDACLKLFKSKKFKF
jgi:PAS domain S-box-containing protein/putative nucleotidyltransferase with HDIG domain